MVDDRNNSATKREVSQRDYGLGGEKMRVRKG